MIYNSAYERGDYDWLYANYLDSSHDLLAEAVKTIVDAQEVDTALDLCAGTGALTLQLVSLGVPRILAVDASSKSLAVLKHKITETEIGHYGVGMVTADLNHKDTLLFLKGLLPRANEYKADLVTCRQGVGYLKKETLIQIPDLLCEGGSFVFNTFVKPEKLPWIKRRKGGITEAGFCLLGRVVHFQIREHRVDLTSFVWHDVQNVLRPVWEQKGLTVKTEQYNRTLIVEVRRPFGN